MVQYDLVYNPILKASIQLAHVMDKHSFDGRKFLQDMDQSFGQLVSDLKEPTHTHTNGPVIYFLDNPGVILWQHRIFEYLFSFAMEQDNPEAMAVLMKTINPSDVIQFFEYYFLDEVINESGGKELFYHTLGNKQGETKRKDIKKYLFKQVKIYNQSYHPSAVFNDISYFCRELFANENIIIPLLQKTFKTTLDNFILIEKQSNQFAVRFLNQQKNMF